MSLKPESHISTLAHICVFLKAPLLPHIGTIHLGNGHHISSGFQYDSCWLFSRLGVSLALEVPNQINSCSCHCCLHQPQTFGLCLQSRMETGNAAKWCSLSLSHNMESMPHAAWGQGWGCGGQGGYHLRYKTTALYVLPVHSPLLALFCHSTKCLDGTFEIWELHK